MRIVFFGTPGYVLPILTGLHKRYINTGGVSPIVAVVTQKPKPTGRKKFLAYSPVDDWAHKRKIPIFFDAKEVMGSKIEADIGVLASYSQIIPPEVISYFPKGILNIHPSLLPKYRGASPVQAAIVLKDTESGGTIIKLDEKLDHGPIVTKFKESVKKSDTTASLRDRIFERSKDVLLEVLPAYISGKIRPKAQNDDGVSTTKEIKKEDAFIDPKFIKAAISKKSLEVKYHLNFIENMDIVLDAETIDSIVRAMQPWPGVWTQVTLNSKDKSSKEQRLKIISSHLNGDRKVLILDLVQLEGKNQVTWKQFSEGYPTNSLIS